MQPPPAVLVVLLDALEQSLALELAGQGRMPALAALLERSSTALTDAPQGFYVGGVWPGFSCSVNPGRHGQYYWRQFDPATYLEQAPPYDDGDGEPFWKALDRAGQRTLVMDVPRSVCVPLDRGVAIHDFTTHDPLAPGLSAWPAELGADFARRFERPLHEGCDRWPRATLEELRAFEARLDARLSAKERAVAALVSERGPFDAVAVGLAEAHCAGHHLWHLHDARHPAHDARLVRELGDPLVRIYARLDRALATLLALAGPDTRVLTIFSHGMGPHYDGTHLLDPLLERLGPRLPGTQPLPWRERLRSLRAWGRRPKRSGLRRLWCRWPSLRFRPAFTVGNNEAWAGVRLNIAGRESAGRIDPAHADEALVAVQRALESAINPDTGHPAFTRVARTTDICWGARTAMLPDLVAEWSRESPFEALEVPGLGRVTGTATALRTGDHSPTGLALVSGPGLPRGPLGRRLPVVDLAPTLCGWLGAEMRRPDGSPVAEWSPRPRPGAGI